MWYIVFINRCLATGWLVWVLGKVDTRGGRARRGSPDPQFQPTLRQGNLNKESREMMNMGRLNTQQEVHLIMHYDGTTIAKL
jgi:hypothetical protein